MMVSRVTRAGGERRRRGSVARPVWRHPSHRTWIGLIPERSDSAPVRLMSRSQPSVSRHRRRSCLESLPYQREHRSPDRWSPWSLCSAPSKRSLIGDHLGVDGGGQYRLNRLRDEIDYYLVVTPSAELNQEKLNGFFEDQQAVWSDVSRRWIEIRKFDRLPAAELPPDLRSSA